MSSEYKIRDNKTGLFSSGGYSPDWSTIGKSWKSIAQVIAHLTLYERGQLPNQKKKVPENWEVVEFQLKEVDTTSAQSVMAAAKKE